MSIKILATADLHIGRQSSSINEKNELITTKHSWSEIVKYAINNSVNLVLLAGDIVDLDNIYFEATGPLKNGFSELQKHNIKVYIVAGNHDYKVLPELISHNDFDNVKILGEGGKWESEQVTVNGSKVSLFGWSFPNLHVTENPLLSFDLELSHDSFNIGLLHTEIGTSTSNYAPAQIFDLKKKNIHAWVLGHIHKPEVLNDRNPFIQYCGSPHALSSKETGVHGPLIITVENNRIVNAENIPLSPVRYEKADVNITKDDAESDIREKIIKSIDELGNSLLSNLTSTKYLVIDINLYGHAKNILEVEKITEGISQDYSVRLKTGTQVLVDDVKNHLLPAVADMDKLAKENTPAGILAKTILELEKGHISDFSKSLLEELKNKSEKLNNTSTFNFTKEGVSTEDVASEDTLKEMLLSECSRLLTNLIIEQQNQ